MNIQNAYSHGLLDWVLCNLLIYCNGDKKFFIDIRSGTYE
jgi:hypothetical protein